MFLLLMSPKVLYLDLNFYDRFKLITKIHCLDGLNPLTNESDSGFFLNFICMYAVLLQPQTNKLFPSRPQEQIEQLPLALGMTGENMCWVNSP